MPKKTGRKTPEEMYTDDELEALRAVDKFRVQYRRLPTQLEFFRMMRELGWTRVQDVQADMLLESLERPLPGPLPPDDPSPVGA